MDVFIGLVIGAIAGFFGGFYLCAERSWNLENLSKTTPTATVKVAGKGKPSPKRGRPSAKKTKKR